MSLQQNYLLKKLSIHQSYHSPSLYKETLLIFLLSIKMTQSFLQKSKIETWTLSSKDTLKLTQKYSLRNINIFFCSFLDVASKTIHTLSTAFCQ